MAKRSLADAVAKATNETPANALSVAAAPAPRPRPVAAAPAAVVAPSHASEPVLAPQPTPVFHSVAQAVQMAVSTPVQGAAPIARRTTGARAGKRQLTLHVGPEAFETVRILGVKINRSNQSMLCEALNDFLQKHGLPRLVSE